MKKLFTLLAVALLCANMHVSAATDEPVYGYDFISACDVVFFKGMAYTTDAIVYDTIVGGAANGNDSIVTVYIHVNQPSIRSYPIEYIGCDVVFFKGMAYTTDALVYDTIVGGSVTGCDSIVPVFITVYHTSFGYEEIVGCDFVTYRGREYTTSGLWYDTIFGGSVTGCDSITPLYITVYHTSFGYEEITGNDAVTYKGITYTSDAIVYDTIFGGSVTGCDSIVEVNIIVSHTDPPAPCLIASGTCGDNLTWQLSCDSVLTISGTGDMTDYEYSEDDHAPWYEYRNVIKSAIISDGVTSIGWWAFYYCRYMTSVEISNSVTSIGGAAFGNCNSLTSVTIPNSVTSIGEDAFAFITSLVSITVAEDNQYYCSSEGVLFNKDKTTLVQYPAGNTATSYVIPNSVTYIRVNAFCHGRHLISVDIPNSVTRIGVQAFYCCRGLTSIEIPNSVTYIEGDAFRDCPGLASIVVASGNQIYDSRDNCNAIIKTATNTLMVGCKNTIIPNSVTTIGRGAFLYCSGLKSIEIPNSVTSIGNSAFFGCSSLTSVINNATTPQSIAASVFNGVNKSSCILYVPAQSLAAYQAADGWKDFLNILPIGEPIETVEADYNVVYKGHSDNELSRELITLHVPVPPVIEGFTFLKWQVVAGDLQDGIYLQAVYTADEASAAPAVYTNPANPAQKLIRDGNVYILKDGKQYTVTGQRVQ